MRYHVPVCFVVASQLMWADLVSAEQAYDHSYDLFVEIACPKGTKLEQAMMDAPETFSDGSDMIEESFCAKPGGVKSGPYQKVYLEDVVEGSAADGDGHASHSTVHHLLAAGDYRDGVRVGEWLIASGGEGEEGAVERGRYLAGKRHGRWVAGPMTGESYGAPDKRVTGAGPYVDDRRSGTWRWQLDGQKLKEGRYKAGQLHGAFTSWHPGGRKASSGHYEAGKKHGAWQVWSGKGKRRTITYDHGVDIVERRKKEVAARKVSFKAQTGSVPVPDRDKVSALLHGDVLSYFDLREKYDTPLRRDDFKRTGEYRKLKKQLAADKRAALRGRFRLDFEAELGNYDLRTGGFWAETSSGWSPCVEGFCFPRLPFAIVEQWEDGHRIDRDRSALLIKTSKKLARRLEGKTARVVLIFTPSRFEKVKWKPLSVSPSKVKRTEIRPASTMLVGKNVELFLALPGDDEIVLRRRLK